MERRVGGSTCRPPSARPRPWTGSAGRGTRTCGSGPSPPGIRARGRPNLVGALRLPPQNEPLKCLELLGKKKTTFSSSWAELARTLSQRDPPGWEPAWGGQAAGRKESRGLPIHPGWGLNRLKTGFDPLPKDMTRNWVQLNLAHTIKRTIKITQMEG